MVTFTSTPGGNIEIVVSDALGTTSTIVSAEQADRLLGELHQVIVSAYLIRLKENL